MRLPIISFLVLCIAISSCRKDEQISTDPNDRLSFSRDSLFFDTIFTSVGSTTRKIKIFNRNDQALNISSIKLDGGSGSAFSININGENTYSKNNLPLNGGDSLSLFVKVSINPNTKNLPFLVQDSISLISNGNRQVIQLLAYGQNAVFITNGVIDKHTTWTNQIPYLINGTVTINTGVSLDIQAGVKIYFHKDALMNVNGNLLANGTVTEPILFCSDRLEPIYEEEPGQWQGINFSGSGNGMINYALIKNASVGITADSLTMNANPKLILSNSIIKNMAVAAFVGHHTALTAFNNLWYNCGNYLIYAVGGGTYDLKQNTFAAYNPNFPRKTAALTFTDYLSNQQFNNLKIDLVNNIIWGSLGNELDIQKKSNTTVETSIISNFIKTTGINYNNTNILNVDPLFISSSTENYELSDSSPALKKGSNLSSDLYFNRYLNRDKKNKTRLFPSSLGCFEKY